MGVEDAGFEEGEIETAGGGGLGEGDAGFDEVEEGTGEDEEGDGPDAEGRLIAIGV